MSEYVPVIHAVRVEQTPRLPSGNPARLIFEPDNLPVYVYTWTFLANATGKRFLVGPDPGVVTTA